VALRRRCAMPPALNRSLRVTFPHTGPAERHPVLALMTIDS
jgi:hypothetical protein